MALSTRHVGSPGRLLPISSYPSLLLVLVFVLPCLAGVGGACADDPVSIRDIVADPDLFHLRQVRIDGVVAHVQVLDPYFLPSGNACYGAYTFALEDDDGEAMLDVAVLGICGRPVIRPPEVTEGDKVTVRAEIQVPNRFGRFVTPYGEPLRSEPPPPVHAVAISISRRE